MIAVALLHPHQATPVRRWTFERGSPILIGRASSNDVVLYSAVISRRHLELHHSAGSWWAIDRGKNGTYANGLSFSRLQIVQPVTLRLAKSGPRLRVEPIAQRLAPALTDPDDTTLAIDEYDDVTVSDIGASLGAPVGTMQAIRP